MLFNVRGNVFDENVNGVFLCRSESPCVPPLPQNVRDNVVHIISHSNNVRDNYEHCFVQLFFGYKIICTCNTSCVSTSHEHG